MSYQHMCVVLGKKGHLYYVVPITTKNPSKSFHANAFHPTDNPSGRKNFILLKQIEYPSFLAHDSVVKCEDLRSVSEKRMSPKIDNIFTNPIYQEIRNKKCSNVNDISVRTKRIRKNQERSIII